LRFCFFLAILTSAYLSIVGLAEVCASVSLGVFCGIAAASDISIVELSLSQPSLAASWSGDAFSPHRTTARGFRITAMIFRLFFLATMIFRRFVAVLGLPSENATLGQRVRERLVSKFHVNFLIIFMAKLYR